MQKEVQVTLNLGDVHLLALQVLLWVVGWCSTLWGGATRLLKWVCSLKPLKTLLIRESSPISAWDVMGCRTPRANDAFLTPPRVLVLCASLPCCSQLNRADCVAELGAACAGVHSRACRSPSCSQSSGKEPSSVTNTQEIQIHKNTGKGSPEMLTEPNLGFQVQIYSAGDFLECEWRLKVFSTNTAREAAQHKEAGRGCCCGCAAAFLQWFFY